MSQISEKKQLAVEIIKYAYHDQLKPLPSMTIQESFESKVEGELNHTHDYSGQYMQKNLKDGNNQSVTGCHILFGFHHHFTKDDFSPEVCGFIKNMYLWGLTLQEFFFHAMARREGLIDTAVKIAETGYIWHRLVKALEDVMVHYDSTLHNSLGDLVQFMYGENGMDRAFIERQKTNTFSLNNEAFEHNYRVDVVDRKNGFLRNTLKIGMDDSFLELQMKLAEEYNEPLNNRHLLWEFVFPMADGITPHYLPRKPSDLEPSSYMVEAIQQLNNCLAVVIGDDLLTKEVQANALLTFRIEVFDWVLGEIEAKFNQSLVNPGEMCGTLAVQSIGEPAMQIMLNTFHYAGVSSKNVTLGVPRLKEIVNVATKIKTPSLSVYLESDIAEETQGLLAKNIQQELAYTSLHTMTATVEIWYDPDPSSTIVKEDAIFAESFFATPDEIESKLHLQLLWCLHLELNHTKMINRKLTMAYVVGRIAKSFKTDLFVIWSKDNSEKLIIHCCVLGGGDKDDNDLGMVKEDIFLCQLENTMLNSISLRGVPGIERVFLQPHDKTLTTQAPSSCWRWTVSSSRLLWDTRRQVATMH
ncbi:hypothetical protein AZE42_12103 [Rhizopogon vesiculosus]|uniref:DNA-directed RNA polymerase n=1 Tax=Rhizopogon vesiculosus TaxID=180088 RepID=A0A1J8RA97_9AGAM|nr:hypothetical protein AZE42_12103 [Rhizopogon vesiculosus]